MPDAPKKTMDDLIAVMAALRTPGTGCPWDLEQDFGSIAPYTIEEAYEVVDAIERGDRVDLKEELGDLLLQVVYHARMAQEEGAFAFADVADAITRKMIRRHPHVFGDAEARTAGVSEGFWERIKAEEKAEKAAARALPAGHGAGKAHARGSPTLGDVPLNLTALTRAIKLQDKAARVGFDWPGLGPVFAKLKEELAELEAEMGAGKPTTPVVRAKVEEEFGDLLFVVANVARHLKIDPEKALRGANQKFVSRFAHIEARLARQGREPSQSTLIEMEDLWVEAKLLERGPAQG